MGIVDKLSANFKDFLKKPSEVAGDEEYMDDEYMSEEEYDEYGDAPKYVPYGEDASEYEDTYEAPKTEKRKASKSGANIYNMNSAPKYAPKYKLFFWTLNEMCDAKNVADKIMDKNSIVIINISNLSEEQRVRVMDFIDGAKYVAKCIYTKLTDDIYAYIPGDVELHGDFLDQVDL